MFISKNLKTFFTSIRFLIQWIKLHYIGSKSWFVAAYLNIMNLHKVWLNITYSVSILLKYVVYVYCIVLKLVTEITWFSCWIAFVCCVSRLLFYYSDVIRVYILICICNLFGISKQMYGISIFWLTVRTKVNLFPFCRFQ